MLFAATSAFLRVSCDQLVRVSVRFLADIEVAGFGKGRVGVVAFQRYLLAGGRHVLLELLHHLLDDPLVLGAI